ncbi:GNAT family N-acetyltransferase [Nocardia inohanensis]|uniref:GNAT family N-acetyltransferase n=1 Tax=Nocardia inohanensis TaxID=209246 RepID=UPI000836EA15|nr:GNAT family N-acetyltransferase [Nocardia inohanensis]
MTLSFPGLEFQHFTAAQARRHRDLVEDVFRRSYVEAIDSGDPFESPAAFMARFDAYTAPSRSSGFVLVLAHVDGKPAGQTWGWPLTPGSAWWQHLVLDQGDPVEFTTETGHRTFALSEIMVCAEYTGRGLARRLHDEILGSRSESRATLLVDPANQRAYDRYLSWGWQRVGRLRPSWADAPEFDVLLRELPQR